MPKLPKRPRLFNGSGIGSALLLILFLGCAYPAPFDNGLYGTQAPVFDRRELTLIFEQEHSYEPVAGAAVNIEAAPPVRLISPESGRAVTDSSGAVHIALFPVAQYDQSVLKQGDIVVDYPAELKITMERGGKLLSWNVSDTQSFARYRDPLYQGLNRDPDTEPGRMTLSLP
jgi:hypothetical protein